MAKDADEVGLLQIQKALRDIQMEIQSPKDILIEFANAVGLFDFEKCLS